MITCRLSLNVDLNDDDDDDDRVNCEYVLLTPACKLNLFFFIMALAC